MDWYNYNLNGIIKHGNNETIQCTLNIVWELYIQVQLLDISVE